MKRDTIVKIFAHKTFQTTLLCRACVGFTRDNNYSCPMFSQDGIVCSIEVDREVRKVSDSYNSFDNSKHVIIATRGKCALHETCSGVCSECYVNHRPNATKQITFNDITYHATSAPYYDTTSDIFQQYTTTTY